MKYRKKPVVIEAAQWFKNGDHPNDDSLTAEMEGKIVRYYRDPKVAAVDAVCKHCSATLFKHGWVDTLEGGHIVCPSDWVITGVQGEHYPCKPDIFEATYELVEGQS